MPVLILWFCSFCAPVLLFSLVCFVYYLLTWSFILYMGVDCDHLTWQAVPNTMVGGRATERERERFQNRMDKQRSSLRRLLIPFLFRFFVFLFLSCLYLFWKLRSRASCIRGMDLFYNTSLLLSSFASCLERILAAGCSHVRPIIRKKKDKRKRPSDPSS